MSKRDTEVKYVGAVDSVEILIPEEDRDPVTQDEETGAAVIPPRHGIVDRGKTITVSSKQAKGLIAGGDFEPVKGGGSK